MEQALTRQLGKKPKAIELNMARARSRLRVRRAAPDEARSVPGRAAWTRRPGMILVEGNAAAALGCMFAGVTVVAWYPITPSSSLPETLIGYMQEVPHGSGDGQGDVRHRPGRGRDCGDRHGGRRRLGGRAGDDVDVGPRHLADGRVRRARRTTPKFPAWCSTSSAWGRRPGCRRARRRAICSRRPCCRTATRGTIMLIPASVEECYTMAMDAFDLAERFQTLVFVMSDLDLGMNNWMSQPFTYPEQAARSRQGARRGRRCARLGEWGRYKDVDGDGIPWRSVPGDGDAGVLHARLGPQRDGAVQRAAGRLRARTWIGWRASSTRRGRCVPKPGRRRRSRTPRSASSPSARSHWADRGEPRSARARKRASRRAYLRLRAYPFTAELDDVHRALRARLRRRAEPRRADAGAAAPRADAAEHPRRSAACCTTAGCRSTRASVTDDILAQEGSKAAGRPHRERYRRRRGTRRVSMHDTDTSSSEKANRIGLELQPIAAARRRCAPAAGTTRSRSASSKRSSRWASIRRQVIKLSGIGCSSKSPAYFLGASHGFNTVHGRMPSVGDRRDAREPQAARHRRQRRRRHRRDRHRPVRAPDAPQPADHLHHRGQRLLRPDEGAVLADGRSRLEGEERRRQRPAADRHVRAGDRARRVVRRAVVLGRQEAAARDAQGGDRAPRHVR